MLANLDPGQARRQDKSRLWRAIRTSILPGCGQVARAIEGLQPVRIEHHQAGDQHAVDERLGKHHQPQVADEVVQPRGHGIQTIVPEQCQAAEQAGQRSQRGREEAATEDIHVGKYGDLWMEYLKVNHPDRYRHLFRLGKLMKKAVEVNEDAYEILDSIVAKYLEKHPPIDTNSTMEMWQIREQAKMMAEEIIFQDIVNQVH